MGLIFLLFGLKSYFKIGLSVILFQKPKYISSTFVKSQIKIGQKFCLWISINSSKASKARVSFGFCATLKYKSFGIKLFSYKLNITILLILCTHKYI